MEAEGQGGGPTPGNGKKAQRGKSFQQGTLGVGEENARLFAKDSRGKERREREGRRGRSNVNKRGVKPNFSFFFKLYITMTISIKTMSSQNQQTFKAIDCSEPEEAGTLEIPRDCEAKDGKMMMKEEKIESVGLFRKNKAKNQFMALLCTAHRSRFVHGCGMFSHEYFATPHTILRPVKLSVKQCKLIVTAGTFMEGERVHRVKTSGTSYINYLEAGNVYFEKNKAVCKGGKIIIGGTEVDSAVSSVDMKITVRPISGKDTAEGRQVKTSHWWPLVEKEKGGGLIPEGRGTVVWKEEKNEKKNCELEKLGRFSVSVAEQVYKGKNITSMFSQQEKIYLMLKKPFSRPDNCPQGAYFHTDLEEVVVARGVGSQDKQEWRRDKHQAEGAEVLSVLQEISQFSSALLRAEIAASELRAKCRQAVAQAHSKHIEKIPREKGEVVMVQGEVAIRLRCRERKAIFRPMTTCFKDMPVWSQDKEFFLEAVSRILRNSSTRMRCQKGTPVYRTISGEHFRPLRGRLARVPVPAGSILDMGKMPKAILGLDGAVFTKEELEQVKSQINDRRAWEEEEETVNWAGSDGWGGDLEQTLWKPAGTSKEDEASGWSLGSLFRAAATIWKLRLLVLGVAIVVLCTPLASMALRAGLLLRGAQRGIEAGAGGLTQIAKRVLCPEVSRAVMEMKELRAPGPEAGAAPGPELSKAPEEEPPAIRLPGGSQFERSLRESRASRGQLE
jgi:hypothetical protein